MSEGDASSDGFRVSESDERTYGLEDRTFAFARDVRVFVRALPRTISNQEDAKQVIRSSGSVGANFIEASEALSRKDFVHRIKICRKEAKETRYWLRLVHLESEARENDRSRLIKEAQEIMLILSSIIRKYEPSRPTP